MEEYSMSFFSLSKAKKILLAASLLGLACLVLILFQYPEIVKATTTYIYGFRTQAGGASGTGALDDVDGTNLLDGDVAIGIVDVDDATYPGMAYWYTLDDNDAGGEDIPYTITPDANGGDKRWKLGRVAKTEFIPVGWMNDTGATDPATKETDSTTTNSRKYEVRKFDGASDENLTFNWQVPTGYIAGIKFRWVAIVSNVDPPTQGDDATIEFELSGISMAANETGDHAGFGSAQVSQWGDVTASQWDILYGSLSNAITVTGIARGELAQFLLNRDADDGTNDVYDQDIDLIGIELKWMEYMNIAY